MHNELFSIGSFSVHSFGVMVAIGIFAAYYVCIYRAKSLALDITGIDMIAAVVLSGGLLGAKVLYWLTQMDEIVRNPRILFDFSNGFVVYGGIIGGISAGLLYCLKSRLSFFRYADLVIPSVALAQGFGRIGCFLAGCCYGQVTGGPLGVRFPAGSIAPTGISLFPIQLVSSGLDFILFMILIIYAKRKKSDGQVAVLYLILYSSGRFVLEYFRGDIGRGAVGDFSTSQFISIFIFSAGCIGIVLMQYRDRFRPVKSSW